MNTRTDPPPPLVLPTPPNCNCGIGNLWPHKGHAPTCAFRVVLESGRA